MTRALPALGLLVLAHLGARTALADDPMPVTTDTREYCLSLADQMVTGELPPSIRSLWHKGRLMCEEGQVKGGLAYIRHAMMMTRSSR